jgi:hypothetical protein
MPMQDAAAILDEILGEGDALIRQRLKDRAFELPHLVIAVTQDGQMVLRSNVSADVLRSFGEDLKNMADELEAPPKPGDTTHLLSFAPDPGPVSAAPGFHGRADRARAHNGQTAAGEPGSSDGSALASAGLEPPLRRSNNCRAWACAWPFNAAR